MKRFYKMVTIAAATGGHVIHLDGRPVKTPGGQPLLCASLALAQAVQKEWAAQTDLIRPDDMPLTQILSTRIDQVGTMRPAMTEEILKYLDTDLVCYHAGPQPEGLADRQKAVWAPSLEWFAQRFGTPLHTTETLAALTQPARAHEAVRAFVEGLSPARFTVLQMIVPLSGSLVLGLAFVEGAIDPEKLFESIRVEERFKAEIYNESFYGADPAQEKKDRAIQKDLAAAAQFLEYTA